MQTTLYLIEDDPSIHDFLKRTLLLRPEWQLAGSSTSYAHALQHASDTAAQVYLVDLGLPDGRGENLLRQLAFSNPSAELLVFTVFGDESRLIDAIEAGATGYVLKGCTSAELIEAIEQIREGGAPISALLARMLLKRFRSPSAEIAGAPLMDTPQQAPEEARAALVELSDRETEVLRLVAQGYLNKEIANKFHISTHTVGSHVKNLYKKLSVHTRVQVMHAARERGLI
jgi:DNA-binding NarL/FixJ family response regulator